MFLVVLTDRLKDFWSGLNQGEIDWESVYKRMSEEERIQAFDILIGRGFVAPVPHEGLRLREDGGEVFVVVAGEIVNPERDGELLCFTRRRYAGGYKVYYSTEKSCISVVSSRYIGSTQK
jgi:hypothetical protein